MITTTLERVSKDQSGDKTKTKRVLLLKPRGFCAGVVRAIDIVQIALDTFGAPIYVRKEIVHNSYVVTDLAKKGAARTGKGAKTAAAAAPDVANLAGQPLLHNGGMGLLQDRKSVV